MALIKWTGPEAWDPFRELAELRTEMERLLGSPAGKRALTNGGQWLPEVDIVEEKDRVLVRADLPGIKREDVAVELDDGVLTIRGERKHEAETKEGKTYRVERSYGSFLRSFTLPAGVEAAKVSAAYKDGVLEIVLPKLAEAKAKQLKVEVK